MAGWYRMAGFAVWALTAAPWAAPIIKIDSRVHDFGTVVEDSAGKVNAVFTIKNPGDAVLRVIKAKPSCSCTEVKYDSIIKPGKTGRIECGVSVRGLHSGPVSQSITIHSNAINEQFVKLDLKIMLQAAIDIEEGFISLNEENASVSSIVHLASKKTDLSVIDVSFEVQAGIGDAGRHPGAIIAVPFRLAAADSTRPDGFRLFTLSLYRPDVTTTVSGRFIIETNHPARRESYIRGVMHR